jgi:hypothetical protein
LARQDRNSARHRYKLVRQRRTLPSIWTANIATPVALLTEPAEAVGPYGSLLGWAEHPFDAGSGGVSLALPCGDFADEALGAVDPAVEALAAQDADFDLDHIEPTSVLGRVVELDAAQDASGLGGRKGLIEGACGVGRQVILHNADAFGVGIVNIDEFADALGVILGGAPRGDFDLAPRLVDVEDDEEIDRAIAAVLAVVTFELTRLTADTKPSHRPRFSTMKF